MAINRKLQLLRSNTVYSNFTAAKSGIEGIQNPVDGEIVLARYISGTTGGTTTYESAIGVYAASVGSSNPTTVNHWTVFKSSTEFQAAIDALQSELDATQAGAGLGNDGSYTAPASGADGYDVIGSAQSLNDAINIIAAAIEGMDMNVNYTTGTGGAADSATDDGEVITAIKQVDGAVSALSSDLSDVKLTGYSKVANATGAIEATDSLETALSKLENSVSAVGVSSPDGTINVTNNGRDIDVNIDGETIVAANDGTLSTALKVVKVIPSGTAGTDEVVDSTLPTNVREAYRLVYDGSTTAIGQQIDIYKDSALTNVYLGTTGDSLSGEDSTSHESASSTVVTGTGSESLNFVYHLENGNYKMEKVDVESFLQESEFGNGLDVDSTNHTVSVKAYDGITVDANGVSVTTGDGLELTGTSPNKAVAVKIDNSDDNNPYLSVSSAGVKLDGDAIDTKILGARTTIDVVAAGTETTADGTSFIKVVKTAGSGSTPDSYAVSTQGIKDYVAGEIAELDGSAVASSATNVDNAPTGDFKVLTSVVESDGVILSTTDTNGSTAVNLKKVAATGAAADVSYSNTTSGLTATTVQAAVDELDGRIDALGTDALERVTSANAGIAVGTKSNHSQELTLTLDDSTTGTGSELTGIDNALTITEDGLFLSTIWDCGLY